ncbi:MAG TPA: MarR family transcriptional regulator [Candidatus Omnitrophota bacterium]|nr:MarR family transcriptional regulator [Candidatus Omnitrophota bacterium]
MASSGGIDFGTEMARLLPSMLREVARRQKGAVVKGNIPVSNIVVLEILKEKGLSTMGELARDLGLTMSAATSIVDKMILEGLIKRERTPEDRRVVKVSLLKKGSELVRVISAEREAMTRDMFKALTNAEKTEYLRLFRKIIDSIRQS